MISEETRHISAAFFLLVPSPVFRSVGILGFEHAARGGRCQEWHDSGGRHCPCEATW